ncbi:hypothetical protein RIF29_15264 [Crotalaria pallida]|uniref:Uncharacterized protein n=1 Tax=Crotalaria pallida TaxID=3830 RepID=A0AAN9FIN7_CROPI
MMHQMKEAVTLHSTHKLPYAMFVSKLIKENDIHISYDEQILMEAERADATLRRTSVGSGRVGSAPMDIDSQPSTFDVGGSSTQSEAKSGWAVMKRELMDHIDSRFDAFETAYRIDLAESRRQQHEDLNAGFENLWT